MRQIGTGGGQNARTVQSVMVQEIIFYSLPASYTMKNAGM